MRLRPVAVAWPSSGRALLASERRCHCARSRPTLGRGSERRNRNGLRLSIDLHESRSRETSHPTSRCCCSRQTTARSRMRLDMLVGRFGSCCVTTSNVRSALDWRQIAKKPYVLIWGHTPCYLFAILDFHKWDRPKNAFAHDNIFGERASRPMHQQ